MRLSNVLNNNCSKNFNKDTKFKAERAKPYLYYLCFMPDFIFYILSSIETWFIRGAWISVAFLMLVKQFAKKRIDTRFAFSVMRWMLIVFAAATALLLLSDLLRPHNQTFLYRMNNSFYWIMIGGNLLPLLLLFKKVAERNYLLLLLSAGISIGWWMEALIIHLGNRRYYPFTNEALVIAFGIAFGIVLLIIGWLIGSDPEQVSGDKNRVQIKDDLS
jgi:hypothetical protein